MNSGSSDGYTIKDLPVGATLIITEPDADAYTTTASDTENAGSLVGKVYTLAVPENGDTVTYTNQRITQFVSVWKTDTDYNKLTGASFTLYREEDYDDDAGKPKDGVTPVIAGTAVAANGILSLGELGAGEYRLVETKAPAGYNTAESAIKIFVSADKVTAIQGTSNAEVTQKGDDHWVAGQDDATWQIRVWNNPGVVLPSTGGPGTTLIYLLGILLTGLAGAGLLIRRRRRDTV